MATPVIMPRQGQSVESCIFSEWYVKVGDIVKKGDLLFSYETDKASFEGEAPEDGTILAVFVDEGDEVPVLQNIAVIGSSGESFQSLAPTSPEDKKIDLTPKEVSVKASENEKIHIEIQQKVKSGEINVSPRARRTAVRLRVNYSGIPGSGPKGRIIEQDIIAYAEKAPKATPLAKAIAFNEHINLPVQGSGPNGKVLSAGL